MTEPTVSKPDREERGYHGPYCSGTTCHCGLSALQAERITLAAERDALRAERDEARALWVKVSEQRAGDMERADRAEAALRSAKAALDEIVALGDAWSYTRAATALKAIAEVAP